ncbi:MAG TPA: DoxX-like family protein [Bacillus sp. (in: firmicutes)]|nr:DoxX-like family protein [Bacillus sp. (in: firmicutes)]
MKKQEPIYVQTEIRTSMEEIWEHTQNPELHTEWDARFTEISYLERHEHEPQQFLYKTKIGFGLEIAGKGETAGEIHKETGERVSSLKFWTDNPLSLIREGRGYWKYYPKGERIEFETQYDYETNFGKMGEIMDSYIFRPLLGWATAWSFSLLKLWLEKGYHPRLILQRTLTYWLVCFLLGFVWIYQGLVPKVLAVHPKEVEMLSALVSLPVAPDLAVQYIGFMEMLFGFIWLLPFAKRRLFIGHIILVCLLTVSAWMADPQSAIHPFNPITLNAALIFLSLIGYITGRDLPAAGQCKRKRR